MKKQTNIAFLAIILFLLSVSIGILHGRKKGVDPAIIADDVRLVLEQQDAIDYLQPYLLSGNIDLVAATLNQFDDSVFAKAINTILENKTIALSAEQQVQLLAAMLTHDKNIVRQKVILDLLMRYFPEYSIFVPLIPHYAKAVPLIVSLLGKQGKKQLNIWVIQSLNTIIKRNDVDLLVALYDAGMPFDNVKASPLLYQVVSENKKPAFIPFFVHQLKADINYSPDGVRTPLIRAVEQKNLEMAKALIAQGANPEQVLNAKVGSARQVAFEQGDSPIELMLRKTGK